MQSDSGTLRGRYEQLTSERDPYLRRGRQCAELTLPFLLPPDGSNGATDLPTPYQATGARGVNNLASRLLLTLLPPNSPFFRLQIDDFKLEKLTQREGMRGMVEEALGRMERAIMSRIETTAVRTPAFQMIRHLLVTGNSLVYLPDDGGMRVFRLDSYVVKRAPSGKVLEIIVRESLSRMELPKDVAAQLGDKDQGGGDYKDTLGLYTSICWNREVNRWDVTQEIEGISLPSRSGHYPIDKCPWIALRLIIIDGEDYGRGYVEEYLGDLLTLEGLTKAIVQAAAASSKVLFLLRPNANLTIDDFVKTESGDVRTGTAEDVSVVQAEKYHDLRVAYETVNQLKESLSYAFLLNSAIQRKGERVTAEEIRYMANELEQTLGGVYASLSQEFQLPFLRALMAAMERARELPPLPKGAVSPAITTGVDAIGRGNDLNKLGQFIQVLSPMGPEFVQANIKGDELVRRAGASLGIDTKGLVPTEEEKAASAQAQQQQQLLAQLGPNAVNQLGQLAKQQMQGQQTAPAAA